MLDNIQIKDISYYQSKIALIFCSLLLFLLAGCSTLQQNTPSEPETIENGIYFKRDSYLGKRIFVVKVDPDKATVSSVRAAANGLEKPSVIAQRENADIAINAGYFLKDGTPAGAFKHHPHWIQKPKKNRGVIGWTKRADSFKFDRLKRDNKGHIVSDLQDKSLWWEKQMYVVGGAPLLIYNGEALDPAPEAVLESFLTRRYARTAVCMDNQNKFLLVVVEGGDWLSWNLGFRNGLTMNELTDYLKTQNCVHALNLDGGKSSTMVVQGKVVNSQPHFFGERPVSDVITVRCDSKK